MRRLLQVLVAAAALTFAASASASITISVTTHTDDGLASTASNCPGSSCSLRDAILDANLPANAGATVQLGAGNYQLNNGTCSGTAGELPVVIQSMVITGVGPGASSGTTITQTDGCSRVLEIKPSVASTVTVSKLEIAGGALAPASGEADGGGIAIDPAGSTSVTTALNDVVVTGNTTTGASPTSPGAAGANADGGGVYAAGSGVALTVTGSTISNNTARAGAGSNTGGGLGGSAAGGGIETFGATLTVTGATVALNNAIGGVGGANSGANTAGGGGLAVGGGIDAEGTAAVTVNDTTVQLDTATGGKGGSDSGGTSGGGGFAGGGGIDAIAPATLTSVWLDQNNANGGAAGALAAGDGAADGGGAALDRASSVERSAITGNGVRMGSGGVLVRASGGGLELEHGSAAVINSTLFGNFAAGPTASLTSGGGIYASSSTSLTLANDTLDGNDAAGFGGNIDVQGGGGVARATGTIFASGGAPGGPGTENCSGVVTDLAPFHNLEFLSGSPTSQCGFSTARGDLIGVGPMLAANPATNGGQTPTLALAPGSPAIGADGGCIDPSSPSGPAPLSTDQRGLPRNPPVCDIGAFQSEKPVANPAPHVSGSPVVGHTLTCVNASWIGDGLTFTYAWKGTTPAGATGSTYTARSTDVGHKLSCSVTATGTYGTATATSATVTISPAAVRPAISHVSETHRTWREAGKRSHHKPPVGTTFKFTLSAATKVTLTFVEHGAKRPAGSLSVRGRKGANRISFAGRLGKRKRLTPGRYTVTIAVAGASGRSPKLSFKIVR